MGITPTTRFTLLCRARYTRAGSRLGYLDIIPSNTMISNSISQVGTISTTPPQEPHPLYPKFTRCRNPSSLTKTSLSQTTITLAQQIGMPSDPESPHTTCSSLCLVSEARKPPLRSPRRARGKGGLRTTRTQQEGGGSSRHLR